MIKLLYESNDNKLEKNIISNLVSMIRVNSYLGGANPVPRTWCRSHLIQIKSDGCYETVKWTLRDSQTAIRSRRYKTN